MNLTDILQKILKGTQERVAIRRASWLPGNRWVIDRDSGAARMQYVQGISEVFWTQDMLADDWEIV